jgi:outer membrane protein assembly factor BamB
VAIASGVFLLLMGGLLLFSQTQGKVAGLTQSTQLVRLQEELRQRPRDEALKQHIRQLDLDLRQKSFTDLRLSHNGALAMIAASALFLASAHLASSQQRKLPSPLAWGPRRPAEEKRTNLMAQYAVATVFGVASAAAVGISSRTLQLPTPPLPTPAVEAHFPAMAELRENWPAFRGCDGSGYREQSALPAAWNIASGQGVRWKSEVPLPGMSSPIRWGNDLFLTGANAQTNAVFKFDAVTGALVWSAALHVPGARMPNPSVSEDTSFAAPTPVTDGQRIYAIFANAEVAALDFAGKQIWCRNLGPLDNAYGHASSLVIFQDRLLVQLDQGEATSKLLALKASTGEELWQTPRPIACSWASPIVVEVEGKPQLVTCGQPWVIGYNPVDGVELWRAKGLDSSELAPSPVYAGGKVIASNPGSVVLAIRPDGQGDVTATNVAWKTDSGVPSVASPASDGQRLYLLTGDGQLTCLDPNSGRVNWTHDFADEFYSSPVIGGGRVLIVTRKGIAHIVENADQFHELGKSELGEDCNTTPALDRQGLYLRGAKHLFCLADSVGTEAARRPEK